MSTYRVTVSNNNIKINAAPVKHETKVVTPEYATSLARTGGQGSKGDSISSVVLNESNELIVTISTSGGDVVEVFNLGTVLTEDVSLDDLLDINTTGITDGQVIQYEEETSTYVPHTLTTTSMTDIDNSNKTDGAVLLYDGVSGKYKATTQINNANTYMIGGSF